MSRGGAVQLPAAVDLGATGPAGATGATGATGPAGPQGGLWLPYRSGKWYPGSPYDSGGGWGGAKDVLYAAPYFVRYDTTFPQIGATWNAVGTPKIGLYAEGGGKPGALIGEWGGLGGGFGGVVINQFLAQGWYWAAVCGHVDAGIRFGFAPAGMFTQMYAEPFSEGLANGVSQPCAGAMPDPWGATINHEYTHPIVWLLTP